MIIMSHKKSKQLKNRESDQTPSHGLARVLSKMGIASRSEASEWIKQGKVRVNGKIILDPESRTFLGLDLVSIEGQQAKKIEKEYWMMNKPVGVLTTYTDPQGRHTVYEFLPKLDSWFFPIGRLDAKTGGLLLFTNDTELGERLTNSDYAVPKTYEVKARGILDETKIIELQSGVLLDDGYKTKPCQCEIIKFSSTSTWLKMIIVEGKNRQIRRMMESIGSEVLALKRTAVGKLTIGDLRSGACRRLTKDEVVALISHKVSS